ncbi:hypothetical protein SBF1_2120003 [Candidatus Desulfosporosinus infrequens]|uniref:Uncharacterized protein n=1 Tax=Candidatus Desulfosporosinus infrequens TaxID=2043169 RepID=A0A2U3KK47_9FIRM|nr:hypothetical protein SBF1_2120003 [Candidatus Desulfosporosinus infrequens]
MVQIIDPEVNVISNKIGIITEVVNVLGNLPPSLLLSQVYLKHKPI